MSFCAAGSHTVHARVLEDGACALMLVALIFKLLQIMPNVLFALATTVSMCWLNLALCCSVMPRYFRRESDVLQHLVVQLILVTTGSLFAAHGQDTALAGVETHVRRISTPSLRSSICSSQAVLWSMRLFLSSTITLGQLLLLLIAFI